MNKDGKPSVTGGPNLKETQTYPKEFGLMVGETILATRDTYLSTRKRMVVNDPDPDESTNNDMLAIIGVFVRDQHEDELWDQASYIRESLYKPHPHRVQSPSVQTECAHCKAGLFDVLKYLLGSTRIKAPFGLDLRLLLEGMGYKAGQHLPNTAMNPASKKTHHT